MPGRGEKRGLKLPPFPLPIVPRAPSETQYYSIISQREPLWRREGVCCDLYFGHDFGAGFLYSMVAIIEVLELSWASRCDVSCYVSHCFPEALTTCHELAAMLLD